MPLDCTCRLRLPHRSGSPATEAHQQVAEAVGRAALESGVANVEQAPEHLQGAAGAPGL